MLSRGPEVRKRKKQFLGDIIIKDAGDLAEDGFVVVSESVGASGAVDTSHLRCLRGEGEGVSRAGGVGEGR